MPRVIGSVGTLGFGAGLMYVLDPKQGHRRRALIRDQGARIVHDLQGFLGRAGRDLGHRACGVVARIRDGFSDRSSPDEILVERVRSRMGHLVSHPDAIDVKVKHGRVTLQGAILVEEMPDMVTATYRVPGVREVMNELEPHGREENIWALSAGSRPPDEYAEGRRDWTPALQLAAGIVAITAAAYATKGLMTRHRNGATRAA